MDFAEQISSRNMKAFKWWLLLVVAAPTISLDVSVKGDGCSKFDQCGVQNLFRTCSCEADCHTFGICCTNAENLPMTATSKKEYVCRDESTTTPVFAKLTCSDDFEGHDKTKEDCSDVDRDPADMLGSLLVTSSSTRTTYANRNCGLCNNEAEEDLLFWTVEVSCPARKGVDQKRIRKQLLFNESSSRWGLTMHDEFLACSVLYYQPSYMIGKLKYCAPDMISSCPDNYTDSKTVHLCGYYHGERKEKSSNKYYKNAHCALCNGVDPKQTDCTGRNYGPAEVTRSTDAVEAVFSNGFWLDREGTDKFKCSEHFSYDPFLKRCRKFQRSSKPLFANSAGANCACIGLFAISLFVLLRKLK